MAQMDFGNQSIVEQRELPSFIYDPTDVRRTYHVRLQSQDEKQKKHQLHYQIDVICTEAVEDSHYIFELFKHQVYINEKVPDSMMDELADRCGKILYPLVVKVNRTGQFLAISNYIDIVERWNTEFHLIQQSYEGKPIDNLIQEMDSIIGQKNRLYKTVTEQDWFINLFFSNANQSVLRSAYDTIISLPMVPYSAPLSYQIAQTTQPHAYKEGEIVISQQGDYIAKSDDITGKVDITYHLYKGSSLFNAITGTCSIVFPSGKSTNMTIEIYHIKKKTPKTQAEKALEKEQREKETPQPKKKKKRYFLFGKEIKL